jgi:hypothetical protein
MPKGVVEKQPDRAAVWNFQEAEAVLALTAGLTARSTRFNGKAEICTLRSQTYSFPTTPYFRFYLPNAEMTLDLEANEVEAKVLTSLASVTGSTAPISPTSYSMSQCSEKG